jgi:hypothetical protein
MAGLKPIGSEKLEGMDKINRILEISRYKETKPQPVNEDKSVEYRKTLSDGNEYQIVKEKNGYVIKKSLNEGLDYLEPMKNRKYYSSYSQAFKRLNLIAKEVNINEGHDKNVSLFENAANEATKYILKFGETKEQAPAAAPAPSPAPAPAPSPEMAPEAPADDVPMDDEMEMDVDMETEVAPEDEEQVTYKTIQKLTGKLAQKIRAFNDDEDKEETMSSKDIKYVINSVLSALNLNDLEEEDMESIVNKLEGVEEDGLEGGGEEEMDTEMDVDMETEVPADDEVPAEMAEGMEDGEEFVDYLFSDVEEGTEMEVEEGDYMSKVEEMIEGMFTESKVDSVLKKYFKTSNNEKMITESKKQKLSKKLESVCESKSQLMVSKKLVNKYPNAKLVGKTVNKNLVFESNNQKIRVTKDGQIL